MKLHGYCTRCHKPRRVTVKLPPAGRVVSFGICDDCQEAEDRARDGERKLEK